MGSFFISTLRIGISAFGRQGKGFGRAQSLQCLAGLKMVTLANTDSAHQAEC